MDIREFLKRVELLTRHSTYGKFRTAKKPRYIIMFSGNYRPLIFNQSFTQGFIKDKHKQEMSCLHSSFNRSFKQCYYKANPHIRNFA